MLLKLTHKAKNILFAPKEYFENRSEEHISVSILHASVYLVLYLLLATGVNLYLRTFIEPLFGGEPLLAPFFNFGLLFFFLPALYLICIGFTFLHALLIRLSFRLLSVRTSYSIVYETMIDAYTPTYLYSWMPLIGSLASIHTLVLLAYGFHKRLQVGLVKSIIGALLIPFCVLLVVAILATIVLLFIGFSLIERSGIFGALM